MAACPSNRSHHHIYLIPQTSRSAIHPPQVLGMECWLDGAGASTSKRVDCHTGVESVAWQAATRSAIALRPGCSAHCGVYGRRAWGSGAWCGDLGLVGDLSVDFEFTTD